MGRQDKREQRVRRNPRDVQAADLAAVIEAYGFTCRQTRRLRLRPPGRRVGDVSGGPWRPGGQPVLDSKGEATLVALACSDAPEGRACWTMQLLADQLVALGVVEQISDETVRRLLKKRAEAVAGQAMVRR
jgi:hypothetical protein